MMKLFSVTMLAAVANGQSFGPDADGWRLVMRHQTARYTDGGFFKPGQYRLNSADENAALYSIMDSIEDFRQDSNGKFTFKLTYPDVCEQPTGFNADCIDDKNYITWNQTSNPYDLARIKDNSVDGYTPLDVAYDGNPNVRPFSGISASASPTAGAALFCGQKEHPNWWYAMGSFNPFACPTCMPAFRGDASNGFGQYKAAHMELHVWGPRKYEKESPLWKKVFKHNANAGLWTEDPSKLTINSNDPTNNFFANLTDIANYKHAGGKFVFKMEWPSLCTSNTNCDDGRNYIIWSQTSNPTTYTASVEGYTALDVGNYNGMNMFNGLTIGSDGSLPLRSTDTSALGAWGVGATEKFSGWPTADSCSGCVPGPMAVRDGVNQILNANEVTLFVFGDASKINCKFSEYASFDGGKWNCNKLTKCKSGTTFQSVSPTSIRDRVCSQVSEACDADGQYQSEAPTLVNDRSCAALTQCVTPYEFAILPPSTTTDRICVETTRCVDDEKPESVAPTATSDRVCGCGANRVATPQGCIDSKKCTMGAEFEVAAANGGEDTVCQKITACKSTEYLAVASTPTTDAVCVASTVCDADSQMETTPSSTTSDRVCSDKCTPCSDNSGLTTGCSDAIKRKCQRLTSSSTTSSVPTMSSDGPNIKLTPGRTGSVILDGSVSVNGVDLSQWLQSLQSEVLFLRSEVMEGKQKLETQRKQFTQQIVQLKNQVVTLQTQQK